MKGYVCIHGHFYQPPRENPWLDRLEFQDSAYPYHDWNARVHAECYAPNAVSRILDGSGRITKIVNNYEKISFDFGPTLMAWMDRHAPDILRKIVEADRLSIENRNGHGNAVAQPYNHMIMPLANRRDKITQVVWGIRSFRRYFGRDPEGMWLPETAVDIETMEILCEQGIRFTVLAPRQARRVRAVGTTRWKDVSSGTVDTTIPYLMRLPCGGELTVFFYNGGIAHEIAFGGLLQHGEALEKSLLEALPAASEIPAIVNVATDGETYGHHHRFGDMALAYALHHIEKNETARLTNYGEYLAFHPPVHEVDIFEKSSWSCVHGVERWRGNCGCSASSRPGWNQEWRVGLRESLDWLRHLTIGLYARHAPEFMADPWKARDDYIDVVLDRSEKARDIFVQAHARRTLEGRERIRLFQLLEMQRNAMLMYTSCGWFFDDISGIEAVQVLRYAALAAELAAKFGGNPLESQFLDRLAQAKSNIPEMGTGADIYRRFVVPSRTDLEGVAVHHAITSFFEDSLDHAGAFCFDVKREDYERASRDDAALAVGILDITSILTEESERFVFAVLQQGLHEYHCALRPFGSLGAAAQEGPPHPAAGAAYEAFKAGVQTIFREQGAASALKVMNEHFGQERYSVRDLFRDEQQRLLDVIVEKELRYVEGAMSEVYKKTSFLMGLLAELGHSIPRAFMVAAEFALRKAIRESLEGRSLLNVESTAFLLRELERWHISLEDQWLEMVLQRRLEKEMELFRENPDPDHLSRMNAVLTTVFLFPVQINMWQVQNDYYEILRLYCPGVKKREEAGDKNAAGWTEEFMHLGQRLFINVEEMMQDLEGDTPCGGGQPAYGPGVSAA